MKIPTREYCEQLFFEHKVPHNIRKHCEKVRDVATLLAREIEKTGESVDIDVVERFALLHDLMKAVTLDELNADPRFDAPAPTREEIEAWKTLKEQYANLNEEEILFRILHDDYPDFATLIPYKRDPTRPLQDVPLEVKIVQYADWRVYSTTLVSLQQRIDDIEQRYDKTSTPEKRLFWQQEIDHAFAIERELFEILPFSPDELCKRLS